MRLKDKHKAGKFTVTVELDPPKSSSAAPVVAKARQLSGIVDAVNIADCPMANMRMSPIALSYLLQEHANIETIFHLTCRDRNSIGLQAELLGASGLGVNNILTLTGDDPGIGDHPEATGVYELNSTELVALARGLNEGHDLQGKPLEQGTEFYIGVAGNPGADDVEAEVARLAVKVEAGANFIQTQPIYDLLKAERFMRVAEVLKIPVMLGLIPLKSYKMASYLHEKVPGISIPDKIMDRMRAGGRSEGVVIAQETLREIKQLAPGVHLMPLNDMQLVTEVLTAV